MQPSQSTQEHLTQHGWTKAPLGDWDGFTLTQRQGTEPEKTYTFEERWTRTEWGEEQTVLRTTCGSFLPIDGRDAGELRPDLETATQFFDEAWS